MLKPSTPEQIEAVVHETIRAVLQERLGEVHAWLAHVESEGLECLVAPPRSLQPGTDGVVQHLFEGLAASAHLLAQHGLDIGVQCDRGSHFSS